MTRFQTLITVGTLLVLSKLTCFAHLTGDLDHDGPEHYDPRVKPPTNIVISSTGLRSSGTNNRASYISGAFQPFSPSVRTHFDRDYFYVESDGMPDHRMMVGITAWQQQVPLPQLYFGENAWRFPLWPIVATNPISAKTHFFRGAIAIAVNGVPIFNPIKNDGHTDTFLAGELDDFGGHAGRADDYHYHTAPLHLQKLVGSNQPIAFALDGYPIYGLTDPDGASVAGLDEFNGHTSPQLGYHYHATKKYPYLNGGFHGVVTERGGQVDPQPHAQPVRPATTPLPGAVITGFTSATDGKSYILTYTIGEQKALLHYSENAGSVTFDFTDTDGRKATKTYSTHFQPEHQDNSQPPRNESGSQRPPRDPNRQPWMKVHALEMDINHDGILTRQELLNEVDKVFAGFDHNQDGKLTESEYSGPPVRSPMGGYVKQHYRELLDETGVITKASMTKEALRMFEKTDANHDGKLTPDETALPPGYKAEPPGHMDSNPSPK